jgi:tetratricopeptide (TPR) repeat protein
MSPLPSPVRSTPISWPWRVLALGVLLAVLGGILYAVLSARRPVIDPPVLDLSSVDPALRAAIEEAVAQVKRSPRSAEAWGRLGLILTGNIFGDEALVCFEQAERLDRDNPRWPYHQGLIHMAYDVPTGLPKLRQAVALCKDETAGPRLRLAEVYLSLGQPAEAREQFQVLLQASPQHGRAHLGLARLDLQSGALAESRQHLEHALSNPLTRKSALALSAELYQRQGDPAAARRDRAAMVKLPDDPAWPDEYVEEAALLQVGEVPRLQMAGKLLDRNQDREAIAQLQQIVADYPQSAQGWTLLGWAQLRQRQLDEAEQALEQALKLDANQARVWGSLGGVRLLQKRRPEAITCLRRAVQLKSNYLEAHFNLGLCLKEEGQHEAAVAAFRNALRCKPLSAPAHAQLGELLLGQHRKEEAVLHLEQAVQLDPADRASANRLEEARKLPDTKKSREGPR